MGIDEDIEAIGENLKTTQRNMKWTLAFLYVALVASVANILILLGKRWGWF